MLINEKSMEFLFKQIASFYKSLADENRLRIIVNLSDGRKSVSKIIEDTELSQPLISHHLKELKNNMIVKTERKSSFVFYELTEPALIDLIQLTNHLLIELNEKHNFTFPQKSKFDMPFPVMMKKMFELMNKSNKEE
ncbi:MAG TPA: ArsR family transcriptional regulator [bacterium]|nr:ArsR family transcriptional regulator [bacterium]